MGPPTKIWRDMSWGTLSIGGGRDLPCILDFTNSTSPANFEYEAILYISSVQYIPMLLKKMLLPIKMFFLLENFLQITRAPNNMKEGDCPCCSVYFTKQT